MCKICLNLFSSVSNLIPQKKRSLERKLAHNSEGPIKAEGPHLTMSSLLEESLGNTMRNEKHIYVCDCVCVCLSVCCVCCMWGVCVCAHACAHSDLSSYSSAPF